VLRGDDVERAKSLLQVELPESERASDWVCRECGIDIEGQFENCWKCGMHRDEE
jgi:rubrerythrin